MMALPPTPETKTKVPIRELSIIALSIVLLMAAAAYTASAQVGNDTNIPINSTTNTTNTTNSTANVNNTLQNGTAAINNTPSIGSIVSSIVNVQGVEFRSELSEAEFDAEYEDDEENAVSERVSELKEKKRDLLWEKHDLQQEMRNGDITREEYVVKHARLQAEKQALSKSLAKLRARNTVRNQAQQAQVETEISTIERDIGNLSGPATSRLLESLLAQGGKVEIDVEDGSVEIKIERDDEIYLERDYDRTRTRNATESVISTDDALTRARDTLGDGNWTASKLELDEDGEYEIKLYRDGTEAEVKIDGYTGTITELERKSAGPDDEQSGLDEEQRKRIEERLKERLNQTGPRADITDDEEEDDRNATDEESDDNSNDEESSDDDDESDDGKDGDSSNEDDSTDDSESDDGDATDGTSSDDDDSDSDDEDSTDGTSSDDSESDSDDEDSTDGTSSDDDDSDSDSSDDSDDEEDDD